jgi:hypothetical protein
MHRGMQALCLFLLPSHAFSFALAFAPTFALASALAFALESAFASLPTRSNAFASMVAPSSDGATTPTAEWTAAPGLLIARDADP